jgi:hypothetical protein
MPSEPATLTVWIDTRAWSIHIAISPQRRREDVQPRRRSAVFDTRRQWQREPNGNMSRAARSGKVARARSARRNVCDFSGLR